MKNINKWLFAAAGAILLTSCADFLETNDYAVSRPGNAELYDYLNEYQRNHHGAGERGSHRTTCHLQYI